MSDRIATEDYADSLVMSGPTGADGADGADGAPGATGATGPEGLNWRGAWNSGTAYAVDDAVSFGGSSWISIQAGTNHSPADDTWWDPLSAKGDTGTTGSTGSTGAAGADATAIYGDPVTVAKGGTGQTSLASLKTAMTFVKGDVGLGNVDNTTDAGKPVSTAQQTALNLKANLASPTFTGTVVLPTTTTAGTSTSTGGTASVGDGTAGDGKAVLTAANIGVQVSGLSVYKNTADTTTIASLLSVNGVGSLNFGPGGSTATDVALTRTGAAAATVTGVFTLTSPVLNTGVSGSAVDTDSTMAANSDTLLASQKAVKTALATKPVAPFGRIKYGAGPTIGYQLPGVAITSTSTVAHSVNTDYTYLLYTPTQITIDQLAFNVTAAPASNANVALAAYSVVDGQPTGAPLCSGTIAVASGFTGIKTVSPGATVIPAGPFAVCLNSDVVMTMTSWRGGVINGYIFSIAANTGFQGGFVARTYAAFTSSPTAWTGAMNNVGDHGVVVRVSTP